MNGKVPSDKLEGGQADYWDDDLDSELDERWAAQVRAMLSGQPQPDWVKKLIAELSSDSDVQSL